MQPLRVRHLATWVAHGTLREPRGGAADEAGGRVEHRAHNCKPALRDKLRLVGGAASVASAPGRGVSD